MGDIINAVADIFGFGPASKQAEAVGEAGQASASAARYAADIQNKMFERAIGLQEPWRQAGTNALALMQQQYGQMPAAFTGQVNLMQDPGYQFRLSEGLKALERSAAARGGLMSGATGKALQRYGQDVASQEYQNAYNRALTQYNAATQREATGYNRLASMAGLGQTAAQNIGGQTTTLGANLGNIGLLSGANQANAALQMGNIRASQYGGYGSALGQALNYLRPGTQSPAPVTDMSTYGGFGTGGGYGNQDYGQYF